MTTPPPDAPKPRGYGRIVVIGLAVALGLGFLRYVGYSPTQQATRLSEPTNPTDAHRACLDEHRVFAAGTERAVGLGHALCTMKGRGERDFNGADVDCLLRGVADVRADAGLATLVTSCRI